MRKISAVIIGLVISMLLLTGCGKPEFGVTENTEKRMVITAVKADPDDFFVIGTLEVSDGEQVEISSDLKKGSVRVEILDSPEEQSVDKLPEIGGNTTFTADVTENEKSSETIPAGNYYLKATCLEKATGNILVEVKPGSGEGI